MTESATGRAAPAGHPHSLSRSAAASGRGRLVVGFAMGSAFLLVEVIGGLRAPRRFAAPPGVIGLRMLGTAAVGLAVNLVSLRLLRAGAATSLNLRGAYLEVLGDLLGSLAVLVAGLGVGPP